MADDKTTPAKTTDATTPATTGHQFAHGDVETLGELTDGEAQFLSYFANANEFRTLAVELVSLSRKVK